MKNFCPYVTYRRATAGIPARDLTLKTLIRCLRGRLKREAQIGPKFREGRHALIRGAVRIWREELDVMRQYRL
jgi:hypothetical protein